MIELFWQSILLCIVVYMLTQLVVVVIDIRLAGAKGKASIVRKIGMERRKEDPWLSLVVLPALPPIIGFLIAVNIPLRPELIISYVETHVTSYGFMIYGFWGAVCGQLSSSAYDKVRDIISGFAAGGRHGNEG